MHGKNMKLNLYNFVWISHLICYLSCPSPSSYFYYTDSIRWRVWTM